LIQNATALYFLHKAGTVIVQMPSCDGYIINALIITKEIAISPLFCNVRILFLSYENKKIQINIFLFPRGIVHQL